MADSGEDDRKGATPDPRDDATAAYEVPERGRDGDDDADTTTWSGEAGPPVLIEEETVVSPARDLDEETTAATFAPQEAPQEAPQKAPQEEEDQEEAPTVVALSPAEEEPTVVALSPVEEDPTVVAVSPAAEDLVEAREPEPEPEAPVEQTERLASQDATPTDVPPTQGTIPPSSSLHPMLLERIEPSLGRGERLRLDAAHWHVRLGRAEHNEIRLYTASASREQAEIRGNEAGEWVMTPSEGKSVLVDGDPVDEPIVLEVGMNLVMGGDHLRCVTEGLDREDMSAQTQAEGLADESASAGPGGIAWSWWAIGAIAALGVGMLIFAWLSG